MKLIDLLVQELPKRGGWPDGVEIISMHSDGALFCDGNFYNNLYLDGLLCSDGWRAGMSADYTNAVLKKEYEAALAASKQHEWDGEGLPPVGARCEYNSAARGWVECEVLLYRKTIVVMETCLDEVGLTMNRLDDCQFRPIRTEAERKREEAAKSMLEVIESQKHRYTENAYMLIYDAIAAGKIPGIKLAD